MEREGNPEAVRIGNRIRAARKRKGISQVELSRRLGERLDREPESVRRTLTNNERGLNVPRLRFLTLIAEELDQPMSFFVDEADMPQGAEPSGGPFRGGARGDARGSDGARGGEGARATGVGPVKDAA